VDAGVAGRGAFELRVVDGVARGGLGAGDCEFAADTQKRLQCWVQFGWKTGTVHALRSCLTALGTVPIFLRLGCDGVGQGGN